MAALLFFAYLHQYRCVFSHFFLWVHTHKSAQVLKKQIIYIFCVNVVVFGCVYFQSVLRPCVIDGYAT